MQPMKFETARFHVDTGPATLIQRVLRKMSGRRQLKLHASHFGSQANARAAPLELLRDFDPQEWELKTVEVRTDTGKFVNSAWSRRIHGRDWWIVIGFSDTVVTVIDTDKYGMGPDVVTSGPLYDFVEKVNRRLLEDEADGSAA
jgi:hypothetical protein